ncbi:MAG TPA: CehA/McbA family metallohydrolase [Polyangiaceae bacterium]|nr:CehA/McbA family metallohydrolase [Polyangiaceae bacterium]
MAIPRKLVAAGAALVTLGIGWFTIVGAPRPGKVAPPKLPFKARGITISTVPAGGLTGGELAEGSSGDFLVQNGRLAFVLGADAPGLERQARYGALLDLSLNDFHVDELVDLRPVVRLSGALLPLYVVGVTVVSGPKFPFLRVEQASSDGRLRLATDFRAAPGENAVRLVTRFHNGGDKLLRGVELGERTRWPGAPTFAPRVGFPKLTSRAEVPWLARQGARVSYALSFLDGPVQASFFFDRIGQVGQETLSQVGDVPPGKSIEYRRDLIVVDGDMGKAVELALRALGRQVGRVEGQIDPAPAWANIEARYPDGKPALIVRARADGHFSVPLPFGDYRLVLRAPGGEDDTEVRVHDTRTQQAKLIAPVPGRLKFSILDVNGAPLPARISIRGIAPTIDPELGPIEQGSGAKNVVYTRSGAGEVELPPGRYRVVASHGSEYELSQHDIEVDSANGAAVRAVLVRSVDTRGWVACDFHVHQAPSHDSGVTLEDRVLSLLAEGIEFAVPTDHNHITDYTAAIRHHGAEAEISTISGVEITTTTWGHFNAYPYPLRAPKPPYSGVNPIEIFAAVRARAPGAVIQVNHPRMPGVGYFNRIELNPATAAAATEGASFEFDAIEVVNGYDLEANKLIDDNLKEYFTLLNFGRRYTATGNSDSHRLIINWAGYPRTYVHVPDDRVGQITGVDVARAVAGGHALVSNGIFLSVAANGTAGPGDTVSGARVTLQIEARAPSWVDLSRVQIWVNGALYATSPAIAKPAPGGRLSFDAELEPKLDSWIVVVARGDEPMNAMFIGRRVLPFAFSNPIFIDADEDGSFRAPEAPEPVPH